MMNMKLTRNHRQLPKSLVGIIADTDVTDENWNKLRASAEKWILVQAEKDPHGYYATEFFQPPTIKIQEFD